ncbi:hypothetical protein J6590_042779 [Homalodisca vitripennis]|nr:hypothetical protein J6590_042779 [Homalodisca vitripennis]
MDGKVAPKPLLQLQHIIQEMKDLYTTTRVCPYSGQNSPYCDLSLVPVRLQNYQGSTIFANIGADVCYRTDAQTGPLAENSGDFSNCEVDACYRPDPQTGPLAENPGDFSNCEVDVCYRPDPQTGPLAENPGDFSNCEVDACYRPDPQTGPLAENPGGMRFFLFGKLYEIFLIVKWMCYRPDPQTGPLAKPGGYEIFLIVKWMHFSNCEVDVCYRPDPQTGPLAENPGGMRFSNCEVDVCYRPDPQTGPLAENPGGMRFSNGEVDACYRPDPHTGPLAENPGGMRFSNCEVDVCYRPDPQTGPLAENPGGMRFSNDLTRTLAHSRNYEEQLHVWRSWHNSAATLKPKYVAYVDLINKAAQLQGFRDASEQERAVYEEPNWAQHMAELWSRLVPLYQQLHTYVRRRLHEYYGPRRVRLDGPLPAHILGNMWGQSWKNIFDIVIPYPGKRRVDVTSEMIRQGYNPISDIFLRSSNFGIRLQLAMFQLAEQFFTSMGMKPMPVEFWQRSMFERPANRPIACKASAWDFCNQKDYRGRRMLGGRRSAWDFCNQKDYRGRRMLGGRRSAWDFCNQKDYRGRRMLGGRRSAWDFCNQKDYRGRRMLGGRRSAWDFCNQKDYRGRRMLGGRRSAWDFCNQKDYRGRRMLGGRRSAWDFCNQKDYRGRRMLEGRRSAWDFCNQKDYSEILNVVDGLFLAGGGVALHIKENIAYEQYSVKVVRIGLCVVYRPLRVLLSVVLAMQTTTSDMLLYHLIVDRSAEVESGVTDAPSIADNKGIQIIDHRLIFCTLHLREVYDVTRAIAATAEIDWDSAMRMDEACESTSHEILLSKMNLYGFSGNSNEWLSSYIGGRSHVTRVVSETSTSYETVRCASGKLFWPFTVQSVHVRLSYVYETLHESLYVDDCQLHLCTCGGSGGSCWYKLLINIRKRFVDNGLRLDVSKCTVLHVLPHRERFYLIAISDHVTQAIQRALKRLRGLYGYKCLLLGFAKPLFKLSVVFPYMDRIQRLHNSDIGIISNLKLFAHMSTYHMLSHKEPITWVNVCCFGRRSRNPAPAMAIRYIHSKT